MLIKSSDDKTKRLKLLAELERRIGLDNRQREWIRDELLRLRPGISGERDAAHYLDLSFSESKNHAVLHDLRLVVDQQVAQIDHLIVDRTLTLFLLDTNNYNGSIYINDYGEFTVEYANGRRFGIGSPLEQSRRHETVLKKVLDRLKITGRAGTKPNFVHVVMVHPTGIIHRPDPKKFATSMVIKADQFAAWHNANAVDKWTTNQLATGLINLRGRGTVKEWGEMLKQEHRPADPLQLPEFMKLREPALSAMARVPSRPRVTTHGASATAEMVNAPVCATCGSRLTPRMERFCLSNPQRFGGRLYCVSHQAQFKFG